MSGLQIARPVTGVKHGDWITDPDDFTGEAMLKVTARDGHRLSVEAPGVPAYTLWLGPAGRRVNILPADTPQP